MFPTRLFPHPIPSFGVPMDAPTSEPGDEPLVCAQWNEAYTPYILGAMMQLWLESTWKGTDAEVDTALGKMYNLSEIIGTAGTNCGGCPDPINFFNHTWGPGNDDLSLWIAGSTNTFWDAGSSSWRANSVLLGSGHYSQSVNIYFPFSSAVYMAFVSVKGYFQTVTPLTVSHWSISSYMGGYGQFQGSAYGDVQYTSEVPQTMSVNTFARTSGNTLYVTAYGEDTSGFPPAGSIARITEVAISYFTM